MNYGKWFTLNGERSDLSRGICVFDYRGFKYEPDKATDIESEIDTPLYPIYAVFTKDGVRFCCHYALPSVNNLHSENKKKDPPIYHQDNLILSLEQSSNTMIQGDLQKRINDAYTAIYPRDTLKEEMNCFFYKFFSKFEEATIKSIDDLEKEKDVTYSSLNIFRNDVDTNKDNKEGVYKKFVIRKLFLDFIFDFEHFDVFQNSPYYDRVYSMLHADFLFDAIVRKANYYYYRKVCSKIFELKKDDDLYIKSMLDYYVEAEKRWVEAIVNQDSDKVFYESDWIHSSKRELDDVYSSTVSCIDLFEQTNSSNPTHSQENLEWKLRWCKRYHLGLRKIVNSFRRKQRGNIKHVNCSPEKKRIKTKITSTAEVSIAWYTHKYDLKGTRYVLLGHSNFIYWWAMSIPPFFLLLRFFHIRRKCIKLKGSLELFMPRMFTAIFAAWFAIYSFVDDLCWQPDFPFWKISLAAIVVLMFCFLYSEITRKSKYSYLDHIEDYMSGIKYYFSKFKILYGVIFGRIVPIFIIAFFYSALIALFISNTVSIPHTIISISGFLSILIAMFVGVFVQMIFDDKSISQSFKN